MKEHPRLIRAAGVIQALYRLFSAIRSSRASELRRKQNRNRIRAVKVVQAAYRRRLKTRVSVACMLGGGRILRTKEERRLRKKYKQKVRRALIRRKRQMLHTWYQNLVATTRRRRRASQRELHRKLQRAKLRREQRIQARVLRAWYMDQYGTTLQCRRAKQRESSRIAAMFVVALIVISLACAACCRSAVPSIEADSESASVCILGWRRGCVQGPAGDGSWQIRRVNEGRHSHACLVQTGVYARRRRHERRASLLCINVC